MNVTTIEMEPELARAKLEAYREALAGPHSQAVEEEYMAAMRGFAELAKGTPLINPFAAIREAAWRSDGRPVLAMARADMRQVEFSFQDSRRWTSRGYFGSYCPMIWQFRARLARRSYHPRRVASLNLRVENVTVDPPLEPKGGVALVPMVPADVLPSRACNLSKHFVLWEVESWDCSPPVDPILLRPIGGELYAVVGQWDLTELERSIIAGTRK